MRGLTTPPPQHDVISERSLTFKVLNRACFMCWSSKLAKNNLSEKHMNEDIYM